MSHAKPPRLMPQNVTDRVGSVEPVPPALTAWQRGAATMGRALSRQPKAASERLVHLLWATDCGCPTLAVVRDFVASQPACSPVNATAHVVWIAGTLAPKQAARLHAFVASIPGPRFCVAVGACASSGGLWRRTAVQETADVVPIAAFAPGCPPATAQLDHALALVLAQVRDARSMGGGEASRVAVAGAGAQPRTSPLFRPDLFSADGTPDVAADAPAADGAADAADDAACDAAGATAGDVAASSGSELFAKSAGGDAAAAATAAITAVQRWVGAEAVQGEVTAAGLTLTCAPATLCGVAQALASFAALSPYDCTVVDNCGGAAAAARWRITWRLWALPWRLRLHLTTTTDVAAVPSLAALLPGLQWVEREAAEAYALTFVGHPTPAPLFSPAGEAAAGIPAKAAEESTHGEVSGWGADDDDDDVAVGQAHPPAFGTARVRLAAASGTIRAARLDVGYLHRGFERCAETVHWQRLLHHTERMASASPHTTTLAYVVAVERLLGVRPPRRARYLRVLVAEVARMVAHLRTLANVARAGAQGGLACELAQMADALQLSLQTWTQALPGAWACVGGVSHDLSATVARRLGQHVIALDARLARLHRPWATGWRLLRRLRGRGKLGAQEATAYGLSGPLLRACGVAFDVRAAAAYDAYDEISVTPVTAQEGDCAARWQVRTGELAQSQTIVGQILAGLPEGSLRTALAASPPTAAAAGSPVPSEGVLAAASSALRREDTTANMPAPAQRCAGATDRPAAVWAVGALASAAGLCPPVGEVYSAVECVNGELGVSLTSNGSAYPRRVRLRTPSFWAAQAYEQLLLPKAPRQDVDLLYACANILGDACER